MDHNVTFPNLHLNDELRVYVSSLYTFNAVDFPNEMQCEKVSYHFYNLRDLIFKDVRTCLSESQIDLFYDERIGDGIAVAVKF